MRKLLRRILTRSTGADRFSTVLGERRSRPYQPMRRWQGAQAPAMREMARR